MNNQPFTPITWPDPLTGETDEDIRAAQARKAHEIRVATDMEAVRLSISTAIANAWADNIGSNDALTAGVWEDICNMCHGAALALAMVGHPVCSDYVMLADVASQHKWDAKRARGEA